MGFAVRSTLVSRCVALLERVSEHLINVGLHLMIMNR